MPNARACIHSEGPHEMRLIFLILRLIADMSPRAGAAPNARFLCESLYCLYVYVHVVVCVGMSASDWRIGRVPSHENEAHIVVLKGDICILDSLETLENAGVKQPTIDEYHFSSNQIALHDAHVLLFH